MPNAKSESSNAVASPIGTLVALRPTGELPPLCCLPAASGSAFVYDSLARLLSPQRPVYALEAPGFDDDQVPVDSLDELSTGYLAQVRTIPGHVPLLLLGWSMGGTLAFDMACRLRARGEQVGALILVDTMAPDVTVPPDGVELVRGFLLDSLGGEPPPDVDLDALWAQAPPGEGARHIFTELQVTGHLDAELDMDTLTRRYEVFRASIAAVRSYRPAARYEGKLTLIKAAETPLEAHLTWDRFASDIETRTLPGDHYSIRQGEGLRALSRAVQECLDRC
jgi:thioesterase domain-containing protein